MRQKDDWNQIHTYRAKREAGYNSDVRIVLPAFVVAFAACCIWLTVRIINRRERWAKRTALALLAGLPLLYVLSVGPAKWLNHRHWLPESAVASFFGPLYRIYEHAPASIQNGTDWYIGLWAKKTDEGIFYDPIESR